MFKENRKEEEEGRKKEKEEEEDRGKGVEGAKENMSKPDFLTGFLTVVTKCLNQTANKRGKRGRDGG